MGGGGGGEGREGGQGWKMATAVLTFIGNNEKQFLRYVHRDVTLGYCRPVYGLIWW